MPSTLDRLETLVRAEREAISALDSSRVLQFANEKEVLFGELLSMDSEYRQAHQTRINHIVRELRQNGILLAHARDIVRDALRASAPKLNHNSYLPVRRTVSPGVAVSKVG
jgi:hypothetical protein